jgi:hypothetical protein
LAEVVHVPRETSKPELEKGAFAGYPIPPGKAFRTDFHLAEHLIAEMGTNELSWLQSHFSQLSGGPPIQVVPDFGIDFGLGRVVVVGRGLRDDEPTADTDQGGCAFGYDRRHPEGAHDDTIE